MANFPYVGGDGVDDVTGDYDLMYGDGGNDHLISTFSDLNDEIVVSGGDGNDRLDIDDSSESRALLFGESGNDTIDGGSKTDRLFGGSGNDLLTGWAGNDYLYGGKGNDRLYGYWTASDSPSNDDDNLYGGSGNDQLFGQAGDSDLHGGTGKDRLTGGKGEDEFWFDTKPNSKTNVDKIVDFGLDNDIFSLARSTFTGLPTGPLAPGMFRFAKVALDGDDHLIYDQEHGLLYFDPDGKGGDPQVLLAKLLNHAALTYADFYVVPL